METPQAQYKAVVFDLDGVIFKHRNFWERMHKVYGTRKIGVELTKKYLKTDFSKLVSEVVEKLWKGKDAKLFQMLVESAKYNPGAKEMARELKKEGYTLAIISSAPRELGLKARLELGIRYNYTNTLEVKQGKITGKFYAVHDFHGKDKTVFAFCREVGINPKEVIAVGDSENDIPMFRICGKAIGFNLLPSEKERIGRFCDVVIPGNDLREVLNMIRELNKITKKEK